MKKRASLVDAEITTAKKMTRRSFLASTGIKVAAGVAVVAGGVRIARAGDSHRTDMKDRSNPDPQSTDAD